MAENRAPTAHGCSGCRTTWTGLGAAHCGACHRTFTAVGGFDKHRRGGECLPPGDVGLVESSSRLGMWAHPAPSGPRRRP